MADDPTNDGGRGAKPRPADEPLERRPDNVGQSGRWRREDGTEDDEVARRYGNEERWHSTEHSVTPPDEAPHREPNSEKPNSSPYERPFAPPGQEPQMQDDRSRYGDQSYAEPGGETGGDQPKAPGKRWEEEGGAGSDEDYGVGDDEAK